MSKLQRKPFDFIGKRFVFLGIAGAVMLIGIVFNIIFGTQLDISFKGGTIFTYSYEGEISTDDVRAVAQETLSKDVTVALSSDLTGSSKQITISLADKETIPTEDQTKLNNTIAERFADNKVVSLQSNSVKPSVGSGFFIKCLFAVVLGAIFVTIYVGVRFRKIGGLSAGVFATLALLHDVLIAYFVYVIFRIPLDGNFIAVILTLVGYSLNGTIVIYDRIRENERLHGRTQGLDEVVNMSVNQTVMRNVITTLSTFCAVVTLCVVAAVNGLESILSFAFPMSIGILAGCYSSVLLSSPLWALWREKKAQRMAKKEAAKRGSKKRKY